MILNEGIKVKLGADNRELLSALRGGSLAANVFRGSVVAALGAVTAQSARMAAQLDRDLRLVQTLGGGAQQNIQRLRHEIQGLGMEFGHNFNELARANYQAVSGGFKSIAESMHLTRAGARLAMAGQSDVATSTETLTKALNAFKLEASDAEEMAAKLWGTTQDGFITVDQLGKFLADLPMRASMAGINFDQLAAAIATLTSNGFTASSVMDSLKQALIGLERAGASDGSLAERFERFRGMSMTEITATGIEQTGASAIMALVQNTDQYLSNLDGMIEKQDEFNRGLETMANSAATLADRLRNTLNTALTEFGNNLLTSFRPQFEWLLQEAESFARGVQHRASWQTSRGMFDRYSDGALESSGFHEPYVRSGNGIYSTNIYTAPGSPGGRAVREFDAERARDMMAQLTERTATLLEANGFDYSLEQLADAVYNGTVDAYVRGFWDAREAADAAAASAGGNASHVVVDPAPSHSPFPAFRAPTPGTPDPYDVPEPVSVAGPNPLGGRWQQLSEIDSITDEIVSSQEDYYNSLQNVGQSSQFAAAAAGILASNVGGLLVRAFGEADNAVASFFGNLMGQIGSMAISGTILGAIGIPGYSSGGYTGASGGIVHPNEFVFNPAATAAIGVGNLERMHATAAAGSTMNVGGITINVSGAGSDPSATASMTADEVARAIRELEYTGRGSLYQSSSAKYGGA